MRLYVQDINTGKKIHLQLAAKNRKELASAIGGSSFIANGKRFNVRDVKAEVGADSATVAALIGGVIGALGGAPGVIAGSAIGALLGSGQAEEEKKQAEIFNGSHA